MQKRFGIIVLLVAVAATGFWIAQRGRVVAQRDFAVAQAMLKAERLEVAYPLIVSHRGEPAWRGLEHLFFEHLGYETELGTDHLWLLFAADHADSPDEARELLRSVEYGDQRDVARLVRLALLAENRAESASYIEAALRCDPANAELASLLEDLR